MWVTVCECLSAAGYVLKMSTDFEVLYNNHSLVTNVSDQHILAGHLHTPQASGHRDSVTVHVTGGHYNTRSKRRLPVYPLGGVFRYATAP